jgi:hypothetical protein
MDGIRRHLTTIVVAFVTAMVAAGGTAAVAGVINANKLNGYTANQLIRVATANSKTGGISSGSLGTATIKAPGKGYLVIDASSAIDDTIGFTDGTMGCWVTLDGKELTASARQFSVSPGNALYDQSCTTNIAWPVAKGTHTVTLVGDNPGGLLATFGPTTISVLFEPFNGAGRLPTPVKPS